MTMGFLGFALVLGILVVAVIVLSGRGNERVLAERDRQELERLRILVDDLKQTAWDHRELDSALSTIIIDKIREHERRNRPELGA